MDHPRSTRTFATIGLVAAVLFVPTFFFGPTPHGLADLFNGLLLIIGMIGMAAHYIGGYRRSRVGRGKLASVSFLLLAIGYLLIPAGALLLNILGIDDNSNSPATLIFLFAGLLTLVTGILAGIAVARARILPGWRRWAMLVTGIAYILSTAIQVVGGDHPSYLLNATGVIWPLSVILNAAALRTAAQMREADAPHAVDGRLVTT
jgi:hypothetical protein